MTKAIIANINPSIVNASNRFLENARINPAIEMCIRDRGYPLIGDYLYNPDMEYIGRQALHSHKLSFPHPITGEEMDFIAPLPEDMQSVLDP